MTVNSVNAPLSLRQPDADQCAGSLRHRGRHGERSRDCGRQAGGVVANDHRARRSRTLLLPDQGRAAVFNPDGSVNTSTQRAPAGSEIAVFLTGLGAVNPRWSMARLPPALYVPKSQRSASATIGGQNAQVAFAGLAPGYAGLYQVNLMVPQLPPGDYPMQVTVGGVAANTAV